ncbi:MAG: hypothetical protein PHE49_05770 [bacterium]|nr:hypothetical protein [bacterium]
MKPYIAIMFLLFANKGFALKGKNSLPEGAYVYFVGGGSSYENLAKANNRPSSDMTTLKNGGIWLGGGVTYNYSILNAEVFIKGSGKGEQNNNAFHRDTMYTAWEMYTGLKAGIHTLPLNLPVQFIPELGYLYWKEMLDKCDRNNFENVYYNEELKGTSIALGFSVLYRYTDIFLKFSYSHINVETINMDNYILELRHYPKTPGATTNDYDGFWGVEGGLTTKTDGRKCYYVAIKVGIDFIKMITKRTE